MLNVMYLRMWIKQNLFINLWKLEKKMIKTSDIKQMTDKH